MKETILKRKRWKSRTRFVVRDEVARYDWDALSVERTKIVVLRSMRGHAPEVIYEFTPCDLDAHASEWDEQIKLAHEIVVGLVKAAADLTEVD